MRDVIRGSGWILGAEGIQGGRRGEWEVSASGCWERAAAGDSCSVTIEMALTETPWRERLG